MLAALRYLTVLPVGDSGWPAGDRALAAFPLVGLLLGLAWAVPAAVLTRVAVPLVVVAATVLVVDAVLTRVQHLSAAASLADALAGVPEPAGASASHPPPPMAAPGTTTLVLALLLRFGLLTFLAGFPAVLVAPPVAGRAAMVLVWRWGKVDVFPRPDRLVVAWAAAAAVAVGWFTAGPAGLGGALAALLVPAVALRSRAVAAHAGERVARAGALVAETVTMMAIVGAVIL